MTSVEKLAIAVKKHRQQNAKFLVKPWKTAFSSWSARLCEECSFLPQFPRTLYMLPNFALTYSLVMAEN